MNTSEQITKLDAAKRQLEMAIHIYFHDLDRVSMYALAAAVGDLLRNYSTAKQLNTATDKYKVYIKPEYHQFFLDLVNNPKNFFKHANKDPDEVLNFYPESAEMILLMSCTLYSEVTHAPSRAMNLFYLWMIIDNPKLIRSDDDTRLVLEQLQKTKTRLTKKYYFENMPDPVTLGSKPLR